MEIRKRIDADADIYYACMYLYTVSPKMYIILKAIILKTNYSISMKLKF